MGHLGTVGTATQSTSVTVKAVVLTAGAAAGTTLLMGIAWDSAGALPAITSVVDSGGNTWTTAPDSGINAGSTVSVVILRARITTPLAADDTVTVTIDSGRGRWAMQTDAFDDVDTTPLDEISSNAPGSSASLSTGATAALDETGELAYAVFGFGGGRTPTIPEGWTGGAKVETTAGSADRGLQVIHRYAPDGAGQEGTLTLSSSSTYAAAIATYRIADEPPPASGDRTGWGMLTAGPGGG